MSSLWAMKYDVLSNLFCFTHDMFHSKSWPSHIFIIPSSDYSVTMQTASKLRRDNLQNNYSADRTPNILQ